MKVVESTMINMSNRNVATSRVANLFGVGSLVEQSTNVKVRDKKTGNPIRIRYYFAEDKS